MTCVNWGGGGDELKAALDWLALNSCQILILLPLLSQVLTEITVNMRIRITDVLHPQFLGAGNQTQG